MKDKEIKAHLTNFISQIKEDRNPYTNPRFHYQAPRMVKHRWNIWGLDVELHELKHYVEKGANVWIPPQDPSKPCILLLAHHDTVPNCAGIDDNGSGMAILDFLAYYSSLHKSKFNIAFAMVDWEEGDPRIWKVFEEWSKITEISWADLTDVDKEVHYKYQNYLHKHIQEITSFTGTTKLVEFLDKQNIQVECVLNFEAVGYTSETQRWPEGIPVMAEKGDFIALIGNMLTEPWIEKLIPHADKGYFIPLIVPMNGKSLPDTRRSDHAVFWDKHIPAVLITDTANFRSPHYHKSSDEEVDFDFMAKLARAMIDFLF